MSPPNSLPRVQGWLTLPSRRIAAFIKPFFKSAAVGALGAQLFTTTCRALRGTCFFTSPHHQRPVPNDRHIVTTHAASNSCVAFACACRDSLTRSCPRARAGEDRIIAWTELVHPPALSRPTRSLFMSTVYSISSNGAFTDEHEASTETLSDAEQMLCYQSRL
jgi:hypothetical protein